MKFSYCMLPDYPLDDSIEMIKTADQLGYHACYAVDETWAGWVACKREIAEVALRHGGSITACHGATREGDAELVPTEMGSSWEVVKRIKAALDPNNVMNPGKQMMDEAYR